MAALLIAEEEDQTHAPPSKQGNSNKARKHKNRKKASPNKLNTGSKGHNEENSGSVASGSGIRRDSVGKRDDMRRDAARQSESDGEMDTHGEEENAVPVLDNSNQSHNELEDGIGRNVQQVEANSSVECEAGTLHSGVVEQPTTTQAERRQQKERERKGKQRQQKRAITWATLEEALARVDTAGASLDTLNALDAAIVSAKRIHEHSGASSSTDAQVVPSSASSDLPEVLRQAEEKSVNLRLEMRAVAKALVENGNTCVVCLAVPKDTVVLPCKHLVMCAACTKAVLASSSQPRCPVCRSRIADCMYGVFF
jgi:hypothetical protein